MQAGYTQGLEKDGRELLAVAVRGTFRIPEPGGAPTLAEEQLPLVMADTFTGEPGFSAPVCEADFAPRKRRRDCQTRSPTTAKVFWIVPTLSATCARFTGFPPGAYALPFRMTSQRPTRPEGFTVKPIFLRPCLRWTG
jgi:hypothetical protein